ncbi:hypothetical protein [Altererythrobacter aquiaggeris]|uniref:hypothetical protein n=1 Tax=Aestuarierythrobacter aquiaggeris TaxID=1898396 RepID=UPI00301B5D03
MPEPRLYHYAHSGLNIASELELPEWDVFAAKVHGDPDISFHIDHGLSPTGLAPHEPVISGSRLIFDDDDAGTYAADAGRKLLIAPKPEASSREIRLFALGSGWGALGYQRGLQMLHASAVMGPQGAVMFAGEAGAGKSTLAAAMGDRGHACLADDLSRVDTDAERAQIWPSAARMKLWDGAIDALGWSDKAMEQDHFRDRKFHFRFETAPPRAPVSLHACYVAEWGPPAIIRLTGGQAVQALLQSTMYRSQFLRSLGRLGHYTVEIANLASKIEVYRLSRPRDFSALDDSCVMLEDHWSP